MRLIAVTGGLASGKSTVVHLFEEMGALVISSDSIARSFLTIDHPIGKQLVELLGPSVLKGREIDRSKLAKIIFHDETQRRAVETLMHPAVLTEIRHQAEKAKHRLVVVEVPLLFEAEWQDFFDIVVCVETPVEVARARYIAAGGDPLEFDRREQSQLPRAKKAERADICIVNTGDPASLKSFVKRLYRSLTQPNQ